MAITCFIRHEIDPFQRFTEVVPEAFQRPAVGAPA